MVATNTTGPVTRIQPSSGWIRLNLREIWEYRELLYFFAWRDIKLRYKQTIIGAAWAIIQPFFTMVVFSIFFGRLAGLPSDGVPYPVFSYVALVPWITFSNALTSSTNAVVKHGGMITKIYFPRLLLPAAPMVVELIDFGIAFSVLIALMLFYGIMPTPAIVTLPFFLLLALATAFATGLWLAALNARYRDVRYVVPFLVQFWMFATPIVYPTSIIPEQWRPLYALNPMATVIEGFRWALLGTSDSPGTLAVLSVSIVLVLMLGGLAYFRRTERIFADLF
jgi:lipopolysaccharide transport system permease protein